jgi:hypothetical protein
MIIDYSAHNTWMNCPGEWYERYINRRVVKWPRAQRDDALALGSLVHEGLRVWQERQIVEIPTSVIDEVTPTRECLQLSQELVYGYTRAYPQEIWPLIRCEEPIIWPIRSCPACTPHNVCSSCLWGLAKLDEYFYVSEPTLIESGIPGITFTLNPGWWIQEYKTKSPSVSMPLYMQGWEMNLQASYQMLALRSIDFSAPTNLGESTYINRVQGCLVNVLEKPRKYIPKRKCRHCNDSYEFYTWIPTGTGLYSCPVCGNRQELQRLKENPVSSPPSYYRIVVTRSQRELEEDLRTISQVGERMIQMEAGGLHSEPWNKKNCVNTQWRCACDYFSVHRNGRDSREEEAYMEAPEYRGLISIEGVV